MKRLKNIMFMFVLMVIGISLVNAKDQYTLNWKSDNLSIETIRHMLPVSDGVLVGGYDDDFHVMMIKLDKTGKEVKSLTLDYEGVVNGIYEYDGKYYFIATNDDEMWNVYVYQVDKDLNIVKSKGTGFYEEGSIEITNQVDDKVYITTIGIGGYSGFGVSDDDDYYDSYYIDLDDFSTHKGSSNDFSKFSKSQRALIYAFRMGIASMPTVAYMGHGFSLLGGNQDPAGWGKGYSTVFKTDSFDELEDFFMNDTLPSGFNDLEDFVINRELMSPAWYSRIVETDDRVVAGGENYPYLDLYDFNGKYVGKIDIVNYLYNKSTSEMSSQLLDMVTINDKLYVAYQYCDIDDNNCSVNCKVGVAEIKTRFNIETKVTKGKGTIEAVKVANSGDEIKFIVKPEKGYVLDSVKVTDANGNTIIFKDYVFTMPSADVVIEATFIPEIIEKGKEIIENPDTKDVVLSMIVMFIIGGLLLVGYNRNRKHIRKYE